MDTVGTHDIGSAIRKVRKERNLRLEDLADENISVATISNIERGVSHVKFDKVRYLLKKLSLEIKNLPGILLDDQQELKEIEFQLNRAEYVWRLGKYDEAIKLVADLQLSDNHPLAPLGYFVKGKSLLLLRKFVKAERALYTAINLCNQKGYDKRDNIEAASFLEIGMCCFQQNDIQKALEFTESGLDAFIEGGQREYIKQSLIINQLIFLERLGRIGEGLNRVQEVWDIVEEIKDLNILLTMYWIRAEFLRRSNMNDSAIAFAEQGLELAIRNKSYDRVFELWSMLGMIYTVKGQWDKAEACFYSALDAEHLVTNPRVRTRTYVWLGKLFMHQERWDEAKETIQNAIQNATEADDAPRLIQAHIAMGDCLRRIEGIRSATEQYKKAYVFTKKHGLRKKEYKILFRLAQCGEKLDEKEFVNHIRFDEVE
ncbi:helix-turn-helix domain-containing protein [Desmospora profundinema]|uniref:Tetratricopeptide (TPR) repeat protein n=1 Tax=Desmospora profundinema TaxID=1571184 RepID=A0ABU1IMX7_9BACL|nr:helix-turn-helix transcriptional regulator [Desmospora profundinema]MDR6226123.1 tetratricopeptide (TPR) repeat protein [Desmospora profundinema]